MHAPVSMAAFYNENTLNFVRNDLCVPLRVLPELNTAFVVYFFPILPGLLNHIFIYVIVIQFSKWLLLGLFNFRPDIAMFSRFRSLRLEDQLAELFAVISHQFLHHHVSTAIFLHFLLFLQLFHYFNYFLFLLLLLFLGFGRGDLFLGSLHLLGVGSARSNYLLALFPFGFKANLL